MTLLLPKTGKTTERFQASSFLLLQHSEYNTCKMQHKTYAKKFHNKKLKQVNIRNNLNKSQSLI